MALDAKHFEWLFSPAANTDPVFKDYIQIIANDKLIAYQSVFQYGNKQGESLSTHILNGICVLEVLHPILQLTLEEKYILFTAYTVHDINKVTDGEQKAFNKLAVPENVAAEIIRLGLPEFFEDWETYLEDITTLIRRHSAHYGVGGEGLLHQLQNKFQLPMERLATLAHLMRAIDVIDLSKTLTESKHKADFLSHLNAYLADSYIDQQYEFHAHQVVEQRGLLSNIIHNTVMSVLGEDQTLLPLLLYPDGVAYLAPKGFQFPSNEDLLNWLASETQKKLNQLLLGNPDLLIEQTNQGIKIKSDALEMQVSFQILWESVNKFVARRKFKSDDLNEKARQKLLSELSKPKQALNELEENLYEMAQQGKDFITADMNQFMGAELLRSYFIMLCQHFDHKPQTAWDYIYQLLEISDPEPYAYFDANFIRPYVVGSNLQLSLDELDAQLLADGKRLWDDGASEPEADAQLWSDYLSFCLLIDGQPIFDTPWQNQLKHYADNNHHQCAHCSSTFPTSDWMAGDIRGGIKVQVFSNRLQGGSNREPKKNICEICRIQFLLEKVNYTEVRGEDLYYLHLFPYSYLTTPYLRGLYNSLNQVRGTDFAIQALNLNAPEAISQMETGIRPNFKFITDKGTAMPYGVYVPQYAETLSGMITLPLNAPGDNDLERFLFALWNALVLQQSMGMRVLLSKSPVPPLSQEDMPDLYLDMQPLATNGFLPNNAYYRFQDRGQVGGSLSSLWQNTKNLFQISRLLFTSDDEKPRLIRAMTKGPLSLYFEVDRLIEKQADEKKAGWLIRESAPYIETITIEIGGELMQKLSESIKELAALAWQNRIKGKTLKRSSLLYPFDEMLSQMSLLEGHFDREAVIMASTQAIFDHLQRVADDAYKPGLNKLDQVGEWVKLWYSLILDGVYGGNVQKLLAEQKQLRSVYLFAIYQQIPRKADKNELDINEEED